MRGIRINRVSSVRKRFFLQYLSDTISVPISSRSFGPNRAILRCFPCKYISIICGGKRLVWRDLVSKSQESSWLGNRIPRQERYWRKNRFRTLDTSIILISRITAHSVRFGALFGKYPAPHIQANRFLCVLLLRKTARR